MQLIAHQELTSAAASITFSDIPQTFTDLYLVVSARSTRAVTGDNAFFEFNSSTSNFSGRTLYGNGSSAVTDTTARLGSFLPGNNATASTFSNTSAYIPNYTSSSAKSYSLDTALENNATFSLLGIYAGLWNDTNAITSIGMAPTSGNNFVSGSSFTLYGILAGSDGVTSVS